MGSRGVPGQGRYARTEREHRWLATGLPTGAHDPTAIVDRYIDGTTLRLRTMRADAGTVYKLGQKVRADAGTVGVDRVTSIYLRAEEHGVLAALAAAELRKTRWRVPVAGTTFAVDVFEGRHTGLVLVEVELPDGADAPGPPPFAADDVTDDERFTGAALARAGDDDVAAVLACARGADAGRWAADARGEP